MSLPPPGCEPRCRACAHRERSPEQSERLKLEWLNRALAPWGSRIEPVQGVRGSARWGYREKTCLRARWNPGPAVWEFGLSLAAEVRGQKPEFLPVPGCPVHSERVRNALSRLSRFLGSGVVSDPERLPLAFVAVSGRLLTLVFKANRLPESVSSWQSLAESLTAEGLAEGLWANLNPSAGNRVFSARGWVLLHGTRWLDGYGPSTFQQLLPRLHDSSLTEAEGFLSPTSEDFVLDLYCGVGRSLARWRARGASALGVEIHGEAVELAVRRFGPGSVLRGRAAERIPQIELTLGQHAAGSGRGRFLVYANPPRSGLEPQVLAWLTRGACRSPERIAYLSCSAGTQSRDLAVLESAGYRVQRILPYDFFPQTSHVETLALLERAPARDPRAGLRAADDSRLERWFDGR